MKDVSDSSSEEFGAAPLLVLPADNMDNMDVDDDKDDQQPADQIPHADEEDLLADWE